MACSHLHPASSWLPIFLPMGPPWPCAETINEGEDIGRRVRWVQTCDYRRATILITLRSYQLVENLRLTFRSWPFSVATIAFFLFSTAPSLLHCAELLHTRTFGFLPTCEQ